MKEIPQKNFVIPYVDQPLTFWEMISASHGESVKEVYFPLPDAQIATGRPSQPSSHLQGFLESGIFPVSVLINPVVLARPVKELTGPVMNALEYCLNNYHLAGVTVTNLSLAIKIKESFPGLNLVASTLMGIYNEQQLVMLNGVFDTLVPASGIIRDLRALETLKKGFRGQMRIIVNESCLPSCLYRTQHFYEMTNPGIAYPQSLCNKMLERKPWLRLTGGWILPQHLKLIDGLYDEIKLAGRISLRDPTRYFAVLESYIYRKPLKPHEIGGGPAAVFMPIEIDEDFYKYTLSCKKNCASCSVCQEYWAENASNYE